MRGAKRRAVAVLFIISLFIVGPFCPVSQHWEPVPRLARDLVLVIDLSKSKSESKAGLLVDFVLARDDSGPASSIQSIGDMAPGNIMAREVP